VSPRGFRLLAQRNLLDVRNGRAVDADSVAGLSSRHQREQASLVLESLLHLIKVLLDGDRWPSAEVDVRRHTASFSTSTLEGADPSYEVESELGWSA
jgi:hypothetical protein